ncbi:peroxidase-related enzyme [Nitratireductor sp. XY-223]|uniref:carboxymuconolactone decarboxylase family protein n=1 Tax=Nitratireductor sp. XY-223 TaxID=2561926 RepID=UPI0010AA54AF|nr:peroxidase-related enzyme [Nitratireductor sp. XY-223]
MSAWIEMIDDKDAGDDLRDALALARTPHGTVDNVMRVHSLRPSTMRGHVMLYRAALHDDANTLHPWLQETVSSYVSLLNGCAYSFANHWANARHLIADEKRADAMEAALRADRLETAFGADEIALLAYARKLTREPAAMTEADVERLRAAGYDDGQILEANQIIGYFNYVNRSLNGLGVTTEGDVIGYYAENSVG